MRLVNFRGTWCAYWRDGSGGSKRKSLRTNDRAIAEQRLRDLAALSLRPTETCADIYRVYLKAKGKDQNKKEKSTSKATLSHFGSLRPDQITRSLCREYTEKRLSQGVKTESPHRELTMLRAAIRWHDPNTKAVFELPTRSPPRDKRLSRVQCTHLIDAAVYPHVRLFIILALTTAGRMGAILDLTWDRVDFEARRINLSKGETHNKRRATVPMNDLAYNALQSAYAVRTCAYVVEWGGSGVKNIKKAVQGVAKKIGVKLSPHVLRHTAACLMAEAGVPMAEIAQFCGHTNLTTTYKVYARYSPDYLQGAAKALEF